MCIYIYINMYTYIIYIYIYIYVHRYIDSDAYVFMHICHFIILIMNNYMDNHLFHK